MTDRKKIVVWATVVLLLVLVGYPLSQGPAGWLITREWSSEWMINAYFCVYSPVLTTEAWLDTNAPKQVGRVISTYLEFWR